MASSKLHSLRATVARGAASASRRPAGPALGVQLRNGAAWTDKKVPGLPLDGEENDDEPADDNDLKSENDKLRKQCKALRKQVENLGETPVAYNRNASNARSRLIVQQAEALDNLNRQVQRLESSRSHAFDMPDLSIFSAKELKALHLGPKGSGLVDVGGGRKELGLLSPSEAQAVIDGLEGTNKASRRAR